jgi:transposase
VRKRLVSQRTGSINQIRAFMLERGIAVRQGIGFLREIEALAPSRSGMFAPDDSAWHRADHFECHGGCDRH